MGLGEGLSPPAFECVAGVDDDHPEGGRTCGQPATLGRACMAAARTLGGRDSAVANSPQSLDHEFAVSLRNVSAEEVGQEGVGMLIVCSCWPLSESSGLLLPHVPLPDLPLNEIRSLKRASALPALPRQPRDDLAASKTADTHVGLTRRQERRGPAQRRQAVGRQAACHWCKVRPS